MNYEEIAQRFSLPTIAEYSHLELEYWYTFLIQTDYITNKIAEATYLGEKIDEDYSEVLQARKYARQRINELRTAGE